MLSLAQSQYFDMLEGFLILVPKEQQPSLRFSSTALYTCVNRCSVTEGPRTIIVFPGSPYSYTEDTSAIHDAEMLQIVLIACSALLTRLRRYTRRFRSSHGKSSEQELGALIFRRVAA